MLISQHKNQYFLVFLFESRLTEAQIPMTKVANF